VADVCEQLIFEKRVDALGRYRRRTRMLPKPLGNAARWPPQSQSAVYHISITHAAPGLWS